ncbi:MAG TPA: NAD(P)(+) transhydrogenase (Re/Si-specific) subunit beta [Longimicrobiales bacterium]|nr:NAD(P)(+) transhydrogenase (Re/Si-specific) subunit beta [Longimicrobiales bacterium]
MSPAVIDAAYLIAAVLFIVGLKRLGSPDTARSGNILGALGMLVAIAATLFSQEILGFAAILAGLAIGGLIGLVLARTVQMTAMPQLVAVFNGFGGGASALVAVDEYVRLGEAGASATPDVAVTIALSILIGTVTFSGSMVAFGKLQGLVSGNAVTYPLQNASNALIALGILAVSGWLIAQYDPRALLILVAVAFLFGILLVIPIGGADMPVVIALLNSYSGLAASAAGFVLRNDILIIAGALVGASGLILTSIMCKAMNRSLANVLFGAFGAGGATAALGPGADGDRTVREITPDDAAVLMAYSKSVVVVPGYGLAVAQAQHQAREMGELLEAKGVDVRYAIHPVAGRMPGHMNVLLAEANVPYPQLWEMEQINPEMERTDVVLIVGANDVVNPAANDDPGSPIYGMPIVEVSRAKNTIVLKRSLSPGFAGIDNPLFYDEKNRMLFGDAKDSLTKLVQELKSL